jgi:hypothetical protein
MDEKFFSTLIAASPFQETPGGREVYANLEIVFRRDVVGDVAQQAYFLFFWEVYRQRGAVQMIPKHNSIQ